MRSKSRSRRKTFLKRARYTKKNMRRRGGVVRQSMRNKRLKRNKNSLTRKKRLRGGQ